MKTKNRTSICHLAWRLVFLVMAFVPGVLLGEDFPDWSVDYMCDKADLILEGTVVTNDMVRIEAIHKRSMHFPEGRETIRVNGLDKHTKSFWDIFKKKGKEIETKKVVVFLEYDAKETNWISFTTISDNGWCGSCGLFWYDDTHCYGYIQMMNPGPYGLVTGDARRGGRVPPTIEQLRAEIKIGVASSSAWKAALALTNPKEKAAAFAKYLTNPRPPNDKGTYLHPIRGQMLLLGKDAVDVLVPILENPKPGDALNEIVLMIYDLGPQATAAVPALCRLLLSPEKAHSSYILEALARIKDPSAIPCVRPFLKDKDFFIVVKAGNALGTLNDRESFAEIAALLDDPRRKDPFQTRDLLNDLHALDREKALPIIQRVAAAENMANVRSQVKGWTGGK